MGSNRLSIAKFMALNLKIVIIVFDLVVADEVA